MVVLRIGTSAPIAYDPDNLAKAVVIEDIEAVAARQTEQADQARVD